ncbi:MAG: helix-turn-helix domain-containing protein [Paludibacteraceae bacterium]|nr:helix-turn-helix domain-containing protein [Paludibacteraceae bacterium]
MDFNVEKMQAMAKPRSQRAIARSKARRENRDWMRMSQEIALVIHEQLRRKGITQKAFAEQLCVSPAYVAKVLKGNENLTLETLSSIQNALDTQILYIPRNEYTRSVVNS